MKFSLIIPCYNEAESLGVLLERCGEISCLPGHEVILVDNGSTDSTNILLEKILPKFPGCRSVRVEKNIGYGNGILAGLAAARGDIIGWTHADLQADPRDALVGLQFFEKQGIDVYVKGRRYGRPFVDAVFTWGMSLFEIILLRKWLWDINAQPNLFPRSFYESWKNPPLDFSLDLYALYQARLQKIPVHRFPVRFSKRIFGVSHWNISWSSKKKFIQRTVKFSLDLKSRVVK